MLARKDFSMSPDFRPKKIIWVKDKCGKRSYAVRRGEVQEKIEELTAQGFNVIPEPVSRGMLCQH